MAKKISNKISISCIDDGTTIHGSLMCDDPLSQGYDKKAGTAVPVWDSSTGPLIYLVLLNGDTMTAPLSDKTEWYYNTNKLSFGNDGKSTGTYAGYFSKETKMVEGVDMPALRIIKDLASNGNLNDDMIQIKGQIEVSGQPVGFSSGVIIQVGELNANGYMGVINFDGKSYLDSDDSIVTCWANLYAGSAVNTLTWTCEWDFNGTPVKNQSTSIFPYVGQWTGTPKVENNMIKIKGTDEGGVLDIATVTCRFYVKDSTDTNKLVATATVTVDDISDEEYMYVFFTLNSSGDATKSDGSPVSLHKGESIKYTCWVAKASDPDSKDTTFTNYYFQPRKADGSLPTGKAISSLGEAATSVGNGFYQINKVSGIATFTASYDEVKAQGKNINGIILATD